MYKRVYHFIAMQRSGHHAIMYWIGQNSAQGAVLYNNCLWMKHNLPSSVINFRGENVNLPATIIWNSENFPISSCSDVNYKAYCNNCDPNSEGINCNSLFAPPPILTNLWNFEQLEFIVLRSPENWLSSFLKYKRSRHLNQLNRQLSFLEIKSYVNIYKSHLNHAINLREQYRSINFDRWFCEDNYRTDLAKSLKLILPKSQSPFNYLPPHGGGSSFDNHGNSTSPSNMDVLNRWRQYKNDMHFIMALSDKELIELAKEYFENYTKIEFIIST